jgi:hypothetical protein
MDDSTVTVKPSRHGKWLLLIHQIPPKPDYFRVKVRRRLQRIGAVALKNSVYLLPLRPQTIEDFRWLLREIVAEGGEATVCEAEFVEGITRDDLEGMFRAERDRDYAELAVAAQALAAKGAADDPAAEASEIETNLGRLRRRLEEITEIDYFNAPGRRVAERALTSIETRLHAPPGRASGRPRRAEAMTGRTWVTRRDVFVDRIASAWLIRRFIDPKARFKFVGSKTYQPKSGEVRFDMFEAEYTHEGNRCTFETLLEHAGLRDRGLISIAEIVHDIDCKDEKFGREEAAGVAAVVRGIARANPDDGARLERGAAAFDDLYASLS